MESMLQLQAAEAGVGKRMGMEGSQLGGVVVEEEHRLLLPACWQ